PENYYSEDPFFQKALRRHLPPAELAWSEKYCQEMGRLAAAEFTPLVPITDLRRPEHVPYDATGRRVDRIDYDRSYLEIARKVYSFGIIGLGQSPGFVREKRAYSPLLKFGLGYLFSQSGSVLYCPICMTDGTLQLLKKHASPEMKAKWIPRLTELDWEKFYDGAMYLTEVQGGSDVGANTCTAKLEQGEWRLYGEKWFCSNIGSKTAMVLARPEGAPEGTKGLGLFLLPRELENGERNKILVNRVKNKLGTCEMATAEIELQGALAYPVGELSQGFAYMTGMLNLSRIYNAIWSVGLMRRAFLEARNYAAGREAFGKPIVQYPLVMATLEEMEQDTEKAVALTFDVLQHFDKVERGQGGAEDEAMLRLMTPVIKFFTAEKAIEAAHRGIEILGGNGCVEDFPLAKILRDSQILAIWEGTANILALDLLRVLRKSKAGDLFLQRSAGRLEKIPPGTARDALAQELESLRGQFQRLLAGADGHGGERACRQTAWNLALFAQELAHQELQASLSK
ncbi:MAG TPA: acyl-CoA dehydrogenase family protein, partial [bacterium]|nr:acyl-CoA dehydrogenase family protein [bacterium]